MKNIQKNQIYVVFSEGSCAHHEGFQMKKSSIILSISLFAYASLCAMDARESNLIVAAHQGNQELVVNYIATRKAFLEYEEKNIWKALMHAATNGHRECVRALIEAGAQIDVGNYAQETALMLAAENGHVGCVEELLLAHANVNLKNNFKMTALILAAQRGHQLCLSKLIAAGADVNHQDYAGFTALMYVSEIGHRGSIRELLKAGASLGNRDWFGKSALGLAARNGWKESCSILAQALIKKPNDTQKKKILLFLGCLKKLKNRYPNLYRNRDVWFKFDLKNAIERQNKNKFHASIACHEISCLKYGQIKNSLLRKYAPQKKPKKRRRVRALKKRR